MSNLCCFALLNLSAFTLCRALGELRRFCDKFLMMKEFKLKVKSAILMIFLVAISSVCADSEEEDSIWPTSCGLRETKSTHRIIGGASSKPHDWPWLAVLCHGSGTADCFCGASVITSRHVITAAHCLHEKDVESTYWPEVSVNFGKHNLADNSEDSQSRRIEDAVMHPDWKTKTTASDQKYDADIAILRLSEAITFNKRVKPICFPSADEVMSESGKVVSENLITLWMLK